MDDPNEGRLCVLDASGGAARAAAESGANVRVIDAPSRDAIADADVLLLGSALGRAAIEAAAPMARDLGVTIILHADGGLPADLAACADTLIADASVARELARRAPIDEADAALELARIGPATVVLTGDAGLWVRHQGPPERVRPGLPGTSAACDAFAGVFSMRWAEHQASGIAIDRLAVLDAAWWGEAAAALAGLDQKLTRSAIVRLLRQRTGEEGS